MKIIVLASLATVALAVGAAAIMSTGQRLAYQEYATTGARVSEPGHNLVGKSWTGENR